MKYIEDEQVKTAFVRMMAKLHAGQAVVLKPFKEGLLGYDNKEKLKRIAELEERLEKCAEQQKILVGLMASGYIEPEIYYQEKHDLDVESAELFREKDQISGSLRGGLKHLDEAGKLMRAVSKKAPTEFDDELFEAVVETATIVSRETICFNLKCGFHLEERLVKA